MESSGKAAPDTVSDRIIRLKKHFKWNDVELGAAAGVTKQAVGQWINRGAIPDRSALIKLREGAGVSDVWILSGKGDMILRPKWDPFVGQLAEFSPHLSPDDQERLLDMARLYAARKSKPQQE